MDRVRAARRIDLDDGVVVLRQPGETARDIRMIARIAPADRVHFVPVALAQPLGHVVARGFEQDGPARLQSAAADLV